MDYITNSTDSGNLPPSCRKTLKPGDGQLVGQLSILNPICGARRVWKSASWLKINPRLCTAHFPKAKRTIFLRLNNRSTRAPKYNWVKTISRENLIKGRHTAFLMPDSAQLAICPETMQHNLAMHF